MPRHIVICRSNLSIFQKLDLSIFWLHFVCYKTIFFVKKTTFVYIYLTYSNNLKQILFKFKEYIIQIFFIHHCNKWIRVTTNKVLDLKSFRNRKNIDQEIFHSIYSTHEYRFTSRFVKICFLSFVTEMYHAQVTFYVGKWPHSLSKNDLVSYL